jgi:hypothetical protein
MDDLSNWASGTPFGSCHQRQHVDTSFPDGTIFSRIVKLAAHGAGFLGALLKNSKNLLLSLKGWSWHLNQAD